MEKTYPLIIVFYLDRAMMQSDIMRPFADSMNDVIAKKNANAIALFIPTDGEERVECINPVIVAEADMSKINQMIEDIKKSFAINEEIDKEFKNTEITPDAKPCNCENGGKCNCGS